MAVMAMIIAAVSHAQMVEPVKFTASLDMGKGADAEIVFSAKIDSGWHVYSTNLGSDGPIQASLHVNKHEGLELVGQLTPRGNEIKQFDEMFGMELRYFEGSVKFVQKVRFTAEDYSLDCSLEYGACSNEACMPPGDVPLIKSGKAPKFVGGKGDEAEKADEKATEEAKNSADSAASQPADTVAEAAKGIAAATSADVSPEVMKQWWSPVIDELKEYEKPLSGSLFYIFLAGLAGGFLALFTPCVWPIIPMTVSFFLKRSKDRKKGIRDATAYGVSIVVIYVLLGLVVTLLFGASALNALSTNAVFNIFFCLLLIVFAASFFGAFELTLPSSWSNKIDQKSETTTGLLSIFLMAFTLVLVSFSCTGPIIGLLLVTVSTQNSIIAPTIGMLGFAIALAIPFTFFAFFPSLLKAAPKSGGWMNVIKVTLGFIELAFALKFLSVADLAYGWHILDRETFLSLWIVIFALLGLYLLGLIKFPHDDDSRRTNVPQFFLAMISLAFAVYMVPGLWGAPLKAISAFSPPMSTQDFNLYHNEVRAASTDYEQAMTMAKQQGKPVMIDFTGFGCVNCRKMEAAVWQDATVSDLLNNKYVLVSLYVDDKTPLAEPIEIEENGQKRTLRTIGDKWSYLQRTKFGANTQPFYVAVDNEGHPLTGSRSYDEDINEYVEFLENGLNNYKK